MTPVEYWPWWQGAVVLATLTVMYRWVLGWPLGISGMLTRLVQVRTAIQEARGMRADPRDLEAAFVAATRAHFGLNTIPVPTEAAAVSASAATPSSALSPVTFLVGAVGGAALAQALVASPQLTAEVPATALVVGGEGIGGWMVLGVAGVLVGFGTRMGSGCTSGHALSGCSLLQPRSMVATALFLGSAVLVSLGMKGLG